MKKTYRVGNIKAKIGENSLELLKSKVSKHLKTGEDRLIRFRISNMAVDARNKNNIFYSCAVEFEIDVNSEKHRQIIQTKLDIREVEPENTEIPMKFVRVGDDLLCNTKDGVKMAREHRRPVIIGCGPAGIFAALTLAESGLSPIVLERGKCVDDRLSDIESILSGSFNPNSNILFGEGGAGMFSDGKLTTGIKDFRITKVFKEFIAAGADEDIQYLSKPHIGTDRLVDILRNLRAKIVSLGGEFRFSTIMTDIAISNDNTIEVTAKQLTDSSEITLQTDHLVLAIGHSARDTIEMLHGKSLKMTAKPFSVGVRVEHSREFINESQYGKFADVLPSAEYKLATKAENGRGVYTFCMCPGGYVIPTLSETGRLCINGMSNHARSAENSNAAVLVDIRPDDFDNDPMKGIEFQRIIEQKAFELGGSSGYAPAMNTGDYLNLGVESQNITASCKPGVKFADISACFPDYVNEALRCGLLEFDKKIKGFAGGILTAAETRSSSPVRIWRGDDYFSSISGIIPCGEGSGYAGGIMSSAVDGIKAAEKLIQSLFVDRLEL